MSWLGFNTSVTGLFASQRKLYTVNHNVANADREGYSRQVVRSSANIPLHVAGQGYIGTGIGVDAIERVRDEYLDKKFRTESGTLGMWESKNHALTQIEGVIRGSEEEGININMNELYSAIDSLSTNPSEMSHRTSLREKAIALTKTLNESSQRLYKQQKDLNSEVKTKIKQVNDYADQIQSLNSQIFAMEVDGSNANDLRDQRDLIVDKLSKIVDVEAEERLINVEETKDGKAIPIKKYEVRIGGMSLVNHNMVSKLKYPPAEIPNTLNKEVPLYQVEWASGGDVKLKGGELKGLLESRDGGYQGAESNGIPYYIERLDEFAQVFVAKVNEIHYKGTNLNGTDGKFLFGANNKKTSDTDPDFKAMVDTLNIWNGAVAPDPEDSITYPLGKNDPQYIIDYEDYQAKYNDYNNAVKKVVRADNISISGDIIEDLNNIATIGGNKDDIENSEIMKELLKTRDDRSFFGNGNAYQGKPEDYLTSIISTLGTDNSQATKMRAVEDLIVKGATNQRLSVSGVNLDEEMANMVKQQHIFKASSMMISTFDQIFDTIVNRLGMVGR